MKLLNKTPNEVVARVAMIALVLVSASEEPAVAAILLTLAAAIATTLLDSARGARWYTIGLMIWAVEEVLNSGILLALGTVLCFTGASMDLYDSIRKNGGGPGTGDTMLTKEGEIKTRSHRKVAGATQRKPAEGTA